MSDKSVETATGDDPKGAGGAAAATDPAATAAAAAGADAGASAAAATASTAGATTTADPGATGDPSGADAKASDTKAAAAETAWPETGFPPDWQTRIVAGLGLTGDALKKAEEVAKRAASPGELIRSVMSGTVKIGELSNEIKGRIKVPTGKDDKPEDVAAFRKALGVPEKIDDYKLEGHDKMSDFDKQLWGEALKGFHGASFNQSQVDAVRAAFDKVNEVSQQALVQRAQEAAEKAQEALRAEYGPQYKANVELANRFLSQQLTPHTGSAEATNELMSLRFQDGSALGEHPAFVKMLVNLGRQFADDGDLIVADAQTTGVDIDKRIDDIVKLAHSEKAEDKRQYQSLQPELEKLIAAQNKRNSRAA